jgi:hypothetical protein
MSTTLYNRQEKIEGLIAKLIEESKKGTPIMVEGQKDAAHLFDERL